MRFLSAPERAVLSVSCGFVSVADFFPKHTYLFASLIEVEWEENGGDCRVRSQLQHFGP